MAGVILGGAIQKAESESTYVNAKRENTLSKARSLLTFFLLTGAQAPRLLEPVRA